MNEILTFAGGHPVLAFFVICSAYYLLRYLIVRCFRTMNVVCRGWPPSHLDADGDWNTQGEEK